MNSLHSRPVKMGFVGAGLMGQLAHLANYAALDNCKIVALADPKPKRLHLVAERYTIPRTYPNHTALLEDPEVEAVVVVTQRPKMGPIALDCLLAGKHVLTEKPMAATVEQAQTLTDTALAQNVRYTVGCMKRHDEGVQVAKRIIDELRQTNELGSIVYARAHCFMGEFYCNADGHIVTDEARTNSGVEWAIAPDWVPEPQKPKYAWFLNVYCHNINLLRYLLDSTPRVSYVEFKQEHGQIAVLDFGNHIATLEAGRTVYRGWDEVTEIYFERGRLRIEYPPGMLKNIPARVELYKGTGELHEVYRPQCHWTWAFRRQAEAFVSDIQHGTEPIASGADAIADLQLVEEMWRMAMNFNH
ncbi:Gfo/Idh/MocA family protein [Lusitaniella coriacea]|uniref:Gfo/Idh/MocA family protein n=1 Tax=Lusitaniella coriacea TaxID=1983105 RepID=UPI001D135BDD|nr:Gfo/Idh/MocA family oxidoreductase [Lusitaniella coriacea]